MGLTLDPAQAATFVMASVRIMAFLLIAPPFAGSMVPMRVKVGLSVVLAMLVTPRMTETLAGVDTASVIAGIVFQAAMGAALGFIILILFSAVQAAGQLIDFSAAFSSAAAFDPFSQASSTPVARIYQMLATLLLFSSGGYLLFAALTFIIGEVVAPPAERTAQQLRMRERGKTVGQDLRSGLWVKDERNFINVQTVLPDTRLRGVRIYDFDAGGRLRSVTEAREGQYLPPASWRLSGVVQTVLEGDKARIVEMPDMEWRSALNPDILSVLMVSPERMSLLHLSTYIKHLAENRQKTQRYDIALWKKVVYPLAALVMVALALPFGYTHNRVGGVSLKIFAGVMLGIFFHLLNGLFSNLGAINSWSPALSAIAPSALFSLAAAVMIWWVERR